MSEVGINSVRNTSYDVEARMDSTGGQVQRNTMGCERYFELLYTV